MAQRLSRANVGPSLRVALTILLTAFAAGQMLAGQAPSGQTVVLAHYDFEDEHKPSGPDTHFIVRLPQGNVQLSPDVRVSGTYSLQISEVAGHGDVNEFQGYFPIQRHGHVHIRFAFLVATPAEEFNIAFAGPQHFSLGPDGLAVWLSGRDGYLRHYSDSIWRKLFLITPFVWYFAEITYNVDAGLYDLVIRQEHRAEPLVKLVGQANATSAPGSAVDKYSFISTQPGRDSSNVTYYIDDLIIWTGEKDEIPPFVAPGRRKFFVDTFAQFRQPASDSEKAGDVDFRARNAVGAKQNYDRALKQAEQDGDRETAWYVRLKLADVAFLLGDLEMERHLREAVYGSWRR
jgi:hypothetical protein